MAVTAPSKLSEFASGFLPPHVALPFFERAAKVSAVQQLAMQVPLSISGEAVPVVTGKATAGWVVEGAAKPASKSTLSLVTMAPKKLACIVPVSQEVVRANPGSFMTLIQGHVAEAIAIAFDAAALHGTSTPFASYIDQTTLTVEMGSHTAAQGGEYQDLVDVLSKLVQSGKRLTGWALDDVMEPGLLGSVDGNGRPIFVDSPMADEGAFAQGSSTAPARAGRLLGRPSWMADTIATADDRAVVGYGGDWSQAAWGVVGGLNYAISTEASITINGVLTSAFENNLFLVRVEAEYGWLVSDVSNFCKMTNVVGS